MIDREYLVREEMYQRYNNLKHVINSGLNVVGDNSEYRKNGGPDIEYPIRRIAEMITENANGRSSRPLQTKVLVDELIKDASFALSKSNDSYKFDPENIPKFISAASEKIVDAMLAQVRGHNLQKSK